MWWLLLIIPVVLIVGFLLFRPCPFQVSVTRTIKKPRPEVFARFHDFRQWAEWSPWIIAEPDCQLTYSDDTTNVGDSYAWDGDIIGAGEMEHANIDEPNRLDMHLRFTKPFKSYAAINFLFNETNDGTEVTWNMDSKMPKLFLPMMKSMIGMDYKRGLHRLADLMEQGSINSRLDVLGPTDRPAIHYLGIEKACYMEKIAESMGDTFTELKKLIADAGITPLGSLSIYHKWHFSSGTCKYIAAVSVDPGTTCPGTISGEIPTHQAYGVSHYGPYDHLGDAWFTAHTHVRSKKLSCPKGGPFPYEIYVTDPDTTPDTDIRTDIFIPIR